MSKACKPSKKCPGEQRAQLFLANLKIERVANDNLRAELKEIGNAIAFLMDVAEKHGWRVKR
jgi:hypothetical protein